MSYPSDPPNPAGSNAPTSATARLSPEDFEQLAATFRPSWELDDAPFTAAGARAESGRQTPRSEGTQADVRGAVHALNGTHAPAPATVLNEAPESSVIIDRSIAADGAPAAPVRTGELQERFAAIAGPATRPLHTSPILKPARAVSGSPSRSLSPPLGMRSTASTGAGAAAHRARASTDGGELRVAKRSRLFLWLFLGATAIGLSVGVWVASRASDRSGAPAPSVASEPSAEPNRIPRPPAETIAPPPVAQAAPVQAPVLAATQVPATATPAAVPPVAAPTAPYTPPPPTPRAMAAPAPRSPAWNAAVTPAPRATPRAKPAATTIVRDVPF
jgi:hypothetical protein